ncbi:MAG: biotin--[acetyl-CoA-carboxylase] ligase [Bryobacteraceae bacterium]|nr:biotin--[acetyl-CoA-carboxylase] ligase [Bryobacteraceae bacterium]
MQFQIARLETTASTMQDAAGGPVGTVVVAEEQTAGQGRLGRHWHSEPGSGLYFSVVLPLPPGPEPPTVATLALGLAARDAIQEAAGVTADLRWPNDLLIAERKCAGILVELRRDALVAGIGVNVNHARFPEELAAIATSLRIATSREHSKDRLLDAMLEAIAAYWSLLETEGREAILRLFAGASSYVQGRRVAVEGVEDLEGTTDGLDPSGFLWLRQNNGVRKLIVAGGLRPAASVRR